VSKDVDFVQSERVTHLLKFVDKSLDGPKALVVRTV